MASTIDLGSSSALVVGAGSGLGAATARRLGEAGAHVVAVDLEAPPTTGRVLGHAADVRDREALEEAAALAATEAPLRVVVTTAGIGVPGARVLSRSGRRFDPDVWQRVIDINLTGTFNMLWAAAPHVAAAEPLEDGQRGVMVLTSSVVGSDGATGVSAYAASKAGVEALAKSVARDLAPQGIRVVGIAPGNFATPMFEAIPAEGRAQLTAMHAGPRRAGDPEEFAALVEHIAHNGFLNATTLRLDAGWRATWDRPAD